MLFIFAKISAMKIDLKNYDTIIFDFGGVILNINPELTINGFRQLNGDAGIDKINQSNILWEFERGEISKEVLISRISEMLKVTITKEEFNKIWCALLLNYVPDRIAWIKQLGQSHRLIMLSNTNEIHFEYFAAKLKDEFGVTFYDLFAEVYLSYKMGLVKPDKKIYEQVIREQNLDPSKTLFIEDTPENTTMAESLGIKTLLIPSNGSFYDYF